jgi:phosphoglycolate phosphatase
MSSLPLHPVTAGQQLRLALFDLDGTLIDSAPDLATTVDTVLQTLGFNPAGEYRTRTWIGNGAGILIRRALGFGLDCDPADVPSALHADAMQIFSTFYAEHCTDRTVVYPGARELLQQWHAAGVSLAIVTNKPLAFTRTILAKLELADLITHVLGGDSLAEKKPSALPLLTVCKLTGISSAETVMIGDSGNDVGAARAAGIPVVCVTYGYNHGQPVESTHPDRLVDSLSELG